MIAFSPAILRHVALCQTSGCSAPSLALFVSTSFLHFYLFIVDSFSSFPVLPCQSIQLIAVIISISTLLFSPTSPLDLITVPFVLHPATDLHPIMSPIQSCFFPPSCLPPALPIPLHAFLRADSGGHGLRSVQRRREAHHTGQPPGTPLCAVLQCLPSVSNADSDSHHLSCVTLN